MWLNIKDNYLTMKKKWLNTYLENGEVMEKE